ncbi:hypothetical protein GQ53DRAFT_820491 [Thozetella sp. PMI_491]|nr:hypothetical protein GQ53DRAFT_820491 [Thozetella sp. PMI_491]
MSLPPETIQVKRKRSREGEDGSTVDFLRVERDNKRHRSLHGDERWVYQRKQANVDHARAAPLPTHHQDAIPVIQVSRPGDEDRPAKPMPNVTPQTTTSAVHSDQPAASAATVLTPRAGDSSKDNVRRFHLSRSPTPSRPIHPGLASKKRGAPALFVERGSKKRANALSPLSRREQARVKSEQISALPEESHNSSTEMDVDTKVQDADDGMDAPTRPNKRPGAAARATKKSSLPPSLINRDGASMDQIARDMQDYTLQQIGQTLAEEEKRAEKEAKAKENAEKRLKYRPKAPAKRFAERHPEYIAQWERDHPPKREAADAGMEIDGDASDDDDYVLETYVRVPASRLPADVAPHKVGFLVFDNEPDVDFFYGDDDADEEEDDPDEDDENAENYYGADYPEDEMEWSDEMGYNPTKYRTRNDSDFESYDVRDWDDEEEDVVEKIWNKTAERTAEDDILQDLGEYADKHDH